MSILVVDDDPDMCWVLRVALEFSGHTVTVAPNGNQALRLIDQGAFPLAFIDARLPDMDGFQLATRIAQQQKTVKIIIISGYYSEDDLVIIEAIRATRVNGFLGKPFQIESIEAVLDALVRE
jgi:CheY-like chemotaxis protein